MSTNTFFGQDVVGDSDAGILPPVLIFDSSAFSNQVAGGTPVITIVTSLPPATATTPIVITVVPSAAAPIRRAWIDFHFPGIIGDEVAHNSSRFGAYYTNGVNTRTTLSSGGYQFTILRDGGWPVGSFPLATSIDVFAVDTDGNST